MGRSVFSKRAFPNHKNRIAIPSYCFSACSTKSLILLLIKIVQHDALNKQVEILLFDTFMNIVRLCYTGSCFMMLVDF